MHALPALRREQRHDVVAGRHERDVLPHALHDAGALVPEHARARSRRDPRRRRCRGRCGRRRRRRAARAPRRGPDRPARPPARRAAARTARGPRRASACADVTVHGSATSGLKFVLQRPMHTQAMRHRLLAILVCAALCACAATAAAKPISKPRWLGHVTVTEYYPVPEAWFVGKKVSAPGLSGKHRIDWLYSATGLSMEGDGVGLDGRQYHIEALGSGGWVTAKAKPSVAGRHGWKGGSPVWRAGAFWLTRSHQLTFPLDGGGWSNGRGLRYVPLPDVDLRLRPFAAAALLAKHRGRPARDPARLARLRRRVSQRAGARLVPRAGHRRCDHRPSRRRLPLAARRRPTSAATSTRIS